MIFQIDKVVHVYDMYYGIVHGGYGGGNPQVVGGFPVMTTTLDGNWSQGVP